MPEYKVLRRVDAWVTYVAKIEAASAEDAASLAEEDEAAYEWREGDILTFDAREFVALDQNDEEIAGTRTGDF